MLSLFVAAAGCSEVESLLGMKDRGPQIVTAPIWDLLSVPEDSPMFSTWYEVGRFPCDGGPEVSPGSDAIEEFIVWRAGYRLTRHAFETNVDYHATFRFDDENQITIVKLGGYSIPTDIDREGRFEIESAVWEDPSNGTKTEYKVLVLRDMWLGSASTTKGPACGHRFIPEHVATSMRMAGVLEEALE